jgi:hypothetical protein
MSCSIKPARVAAERVGQDDVGARIDKALVQRLDPVGVEFQPHLRRIAGRKPHIEQVRARRTIGQQHVFFGHKGCKVGHWISGLHCFQA